MPEKHFFSIKTVYKINVTCGVCVIYVGASCLCELLSERYGRY